MDSLSASSNKKIWWTCQTHGHPYQTTPRHKTNGQGCSVCNGKQVHAGFNDLATLQPDIAAQWHKEKNGDLLPTMVPRAYSKKVWWTCKLGHEFEALAGNRRDSSHCPVCSGNVILPGFNDAATLLPHLVDKFHPTKNGNVLLTAIGKSYATKLWWIPECGHEVESLIANCVVKIPCSICNGKKVLVGFNDIATTHPDIAALWHPTNNLPDTIRTVTAGSKTKRWWICSEGHEDFALPNNVIAKHGRCSYCAGNKLTIGVNDFQTLYPKIANEWHPTLNDNVLPHMIAAGSQKKYWWKCSTCEQSWESSPDSRGKRKNGCPVCAGQKFVEGVNDLATVFPKVAKLWHPILNDDLKPNQITSKNPRIIWWKCSDGHEWQSSVNGMAKSISIGQIGCGICYRKKLPSGSKSLAEIWPDIAKEWDYKKNNTTPDKLAQFSPKSVWWKCSINPSHSWKATIANRTFHGSNCAVCWKEGSGSQAEEDVALFLESLGLKVERKVITMLENRRELDIYLPEYNVAVEYNGLHWHSEKYRERKYHINKYQECKDKGITLIQIWEDDWLYRKEIIQRHLAYRFNKMDLLKEIEVAMSDEWFEKHSARNLLPQHISFKEAQEFLDATHIQGSSNCTYYFGLFSKEKKIVSVLTLTKNDNEGEYFLARYANRGIVAGGFTKLLKYAVAEVNPTKIITFSDHAISNGALYENNGFRNDGSMPEDYMYVKAKKRLHKFSLQVGKIKSNPNMVYFDGLNEKELAELNGFIRIWDAGKTRWIWLKPESQ